MDPKRRRIAHLVALGVFIVALVVVAITTDLRDRFTLDGLRAIAAGYGVWSVLVFCGVFCAGLLLYVPGMVFLAVAVLTWGRTLGAVIAFASALVAVTLSFVLVRVAGGQPLAEARNPWVRRLIAGLDKRPILTVFVLRTVFWTSPPLNYGFALSSLRFRDHLIGSALGLVAPVAVVALFTERVLAMLGA